MAKDGEVEIDTDELEQAVATELEGVDTAANEILEDQQRGEEPEGKKDVILLYKPKCLECTHLFPEGGKKVYNGCHFKAGNDECPAKGLKIVIAVPAERVSDLMLDAMLSNDVVRLSELTAKLNRKDPAEIERVMKRFREKVAAHETGA